MRDQGSSLDWAIPLCLVLLILTVIPLLPMAAWGLVHWLFAHRSPTLYGRHIPIQSLWFWSLACLTIFGPLALVLTSIGERRDKRRDEQSLDYAPMRFALCYATVQEIDKYSTNHLAKHIGLATKYWRLFLPQLRMLLNPARRGDTRSPAAIPEAVEIATVIESSLDDETLAEIQHHGFAGSKGLQKYLSWFPQIDMLRMSHPWFKLEPGTVKVVDAFNSLSLKIGGRLKDKKDIPAVANVLSQLAIYLYTIIPELSSGEHGEERVKVLGEQALVKFADAVQNLPPYEEELRPLATKERASRRVVGIFIWLASLFSHENLLVKFGAWWLLIQVIILLVLAVALQSVTKFRTDSTLLVFAIGTPLLVAAAALATPARKK